MRRMAAIFLALATALPATPAAAESAQAAIEARGRIEGMTRQRPEDVRIRDASGRSRVAQGSEYLRRGDHILLTGRNTQVRLFLKGRRGVVTLNAAETTDFAINGPPPSGLIQKASDFLGRFNFVFADRPASALTSTSGRLDEVDAANEPPMPVAGGFQKIAPQTAAPMFAWRGTATEVRLRGAGGTDLRRLPVDGVQAIEVPIDPSLRSGELVAVGPSGSSQPLRFTRASGAVPQPPFLQRSSVGDEARLVHALWLASDGPEEWRLEGLSRLAELAKTDFAAARVVETYRH